MTTNHITTQGISFKIVVTKYEIWFIDENAETLTWVNNKVNRGLVGAMVEELETRVIDRSNKLRNSLVAA